MVDSLAELRGGGNIVRERGRAGVKPIRFVAARDAVHERDALPLDRVGDEDVRAIGNRREVAEDSLEDAEVVTVAAADVPSERAELHLERSDISDIRDSGVRW